MVELTKLGKKDFDNVLSKYNLGKYKSSDHAWWAFDNTVYIIKTSRGKYILKILEKANKESAKFQIKIVDFVSRKGVSVPKIIKTKDKKLFLVYKKKISFIQEFVKGNNKWAFNKPLIKDVAKKQALMNKSLLRLKLRGKHTWGEHEFKPLWPKVKKFSSLNIEKEVDDYLERTKIIDKSKLRKSVIHGDFNASNILLKHNKLIAIIDFDDVHEDFLVFELAIFIAHLFVSDKRIDKEGIKVYLEEYQKILPLNAEEKKAIYFFILSRYLGVIAWNVKQMEKHKDKRKELKKSGNNFVKRYRLFSKMPLQKFLDLFD